jgi:hypothetical protein
MMMQCTNGWSRVTLCHPRVLRSKRAITCHRGLATERMGPADRSDAATPRCRQPGLSVLASGTQQTRGHTPIPTLRLQ